MIKEWLRELCPEIKEWQIECIDDHLIRDISSMKKLSDARGKELEEIRKIGEQVNYPRDGKHWIQHLIDDNNRLKLNQKS